MRVFLCVDGGGTKTSAWLACRDGAGVRYARGDGGPGNLTGGADACVSATRAAVSAAVARLNSDADGADGADDADDADGAAWPVFEAVWAGYAGCGRRADRELLAPRLRALFEGAAVRVTSDGDLLCAPLRAGAEAEAEAEAGAAGLGATLVCGTGSMAQLWAVPPAAESAEPRRLLRSGGWGPFLDDRGSAFSLGKAAVCSVLHGAANGLPLLRWQGAVLAQLGTDAAGLLRAASALDAALPPAAADAARKTAVAGLAGLVVGAARAGDAEAARILRRGAREVCEVLEPVCDSLADRGAHSAHGAATLVVAGALALDPTFWAAVEAQFRERGWSWARTVRVEEPARAGLELLLAEAEAEAETSPSGE